jgi:alcohol dehydrogenase
MTIATPAQPAAAMSAPPQTPYWTSYSNTASRVILWPDAIDAMPNEIKALGCQRLMLLCGGSTRRSKLYDRVTSVLGELIVATIDDVAQHAPSSLVMRGAKLAVERKVDGFVAVGGGSASDTAKGISIVLAEGGDISEHASRFVPPDQFFPKELHNPKLPVIAVPTTASAAEVTPGLGVTNAEGRKMLFWDVKLASRLIVLDPKANTEVPASLMAQTAMNGFAHCVEGLYSRLRNPISEGIAMQGIRILYKEVPAMVADPTAVDHRAGVLAGAHLSGMVISNARVGIHHAMCHCLGARGSLGHGEANSIMLPFAMEYNIDVATAELANMAPAMGVDTAGLDQREAAQAAIDAVRKLQKASGVPTRLRDTKLKQDMLPEIAEHTLVDRGLFFNPRRTADAAPILKILEAAW